MSRSEAVQPSPPQAREGYRHVAITLHCAIHETHDRTQTAKIVGSLAQAESALNSCGLPGPGSDPADAFSAGPRTTTTHVNEAGNA